MKFRIFAHKSTVLSGYDIISDTGACSKRKGVMWEIELWLYKISFTFVFTWWTEL